MCLITIKGYSIYLPLLLFERNVKFMQITEVDLLMGLTWLISFDKMVVSTKGS